MDLLVMIGTGVAIVVTIISAIVTIVVAFRQSILWGIVYLLVPFGNLAFIILHWAEAKKSVLISIGSGLVALAGISMITGELERFTVNPTERASDLTTEIQEKRDRIHHLETQFSAGASVLSQQYEDLQARRKVLMVSDTSAVSEFNAVAAQYQEQNEQRKMLLQEIEVEKKALDGLLAERSKNASLSPAGGTGGSHRVVMYTTARCPACTRAKQYMAQRGISYDERDVERSPADFAEFQRLGGRGVPLILVGEKRIEGFNPSALEAVL